MSNRRTGKLPAAIFALYEACEALAADENLQPSGDALTIFQAVASAINAEHAGGAGLVVLNRALGQARRRNPAAFHALREWLSLPRVQDYARASGVMWAWHVWRDALDGLTAGKKASEAFGATLPGRRTTLELSIYDDAAVIALYLERVEGLRADAARTRASEMLEGVSPLDRRTIQRHQTLWRDALAADADELHTQYALALARVEASNTTSAETLTDNKGVCTR